MTPTALLTDTYHADPDGQAYLASSCVEYIRLNHVYDCPGLQRSPLHGRGYRSGTQRSAFRQIHGRQHTRDRHAVPEPKRLDGDSHALVLGRHCRERPSPAIYGALSMRGNEERIRKTRTTAFSIPSELRRPGPGADLSCCWVGWWRSQLSDELLSELCGLSTGTE